MAPFEHVIRLQHVQKFFGAIQGLRDINLFVGRNEFVGLIGDNGAGKSTLIKVMTGLMPPIPGRIFVRDREIDTTDYSGGQAQRAVRGLGAGDDDPAIQAGAGGASGLHRRHRTPRQRRRRRPGQAGRLGRCGRHRRQFAAHHPAARLSAQRVRLCRHRPLRRRQPHRAADDPDRTSQGRRPGHGLRRLQPSRTRPATSRATIDGLKSGYVTVTLDQLLYMQGVLPVLQCVMSAKYKMPGLDINTGAGVVTPQTIAPLVPLIDAGYR